MVCGGNNYSDCVWCVVYCFRCEVDPSNGKESKLSGK